MFAKAMQKITGNLPIFNFKQLEKNLKLCKKNFWNTFSPLSSQKYRHPQKFTRKSPERMRKQVSKCRIDQRDIIRGF